jgi:hypothetical protein
MTKRIGGGQSFVEQLSAARGAIAPEALYAELAELVRTMPDLEAIGEIPPDTHKWLARAYVLVAGTGDNNDASSLKVSTSLMFTPMREVPAAEIRAIVYRALAVAESRAPASAQGAFIAAGNVFDAMARIGKVLGTASRDVLIIDPYMDEKTLTDFAVLVAERVAIRLLADKHYVKAAPLRPAVER